MEAGRWSGAQGPRGAGCGGLLSASGTPGALLVATALHGRTDGQGPAVATVHLAGREERGSHKGHSLRWTK